MTFKWAKHKSDNVLKNVWYGETKRRLAVCSILENLKGLELVLNEDRHERDVDIGLVIRR